MDSILRELSLQTLTPRFQQQRITPRAVEALEDEDLIRLGVITIGDRINLRDLCREHEARGVNVSAGPSGVRRTSASSVSVERQLLFHCDRENRNRRRRYGGPTTTRRETSKKSRRSYTITCVCLADRCAEVVPRPAERHLLQNAGLGVRKVQFCTDDDENEVIAKIQGTFPKLQDSGGFEILQCTGNGRNLSVIKSNWSIEELKTRIGPQAKIYLRPIQKSLSTNSVTCTQTTNLTETCNGCKQIFPILELREHMLMCVNIVSSDSDSELPPPPLAVATPEDEHEPGLLQTTSDSIVADTRIRQVTSEMQEEEVTRNDSLEVQNVHYGQNESGHDKEAEETSVNSIAQHTVEYCQQNNISDPVEVLRYYQSKLQKGRKLDMTSLETCEEGETNYILVDRSHLLETSFDEIREIKDFRITLEVGFYDEKAADYGGPRKEFFRLALLKIKEKYFDAGLKMHLSEDYYLVGVIMALSIMQNGKLPVFMSEEILTELIHGSSDELNACVKELQNGLEVLGVYTLLRHIPTFVHLFRYSPAARLTKRKIVSLLDPKFSPDGSNHRQFENKIYAAFLKYLSEVAGGRREPVTLNHILQFVTCADEEPVLGYELHPSIVFSKVENSFLPTANTCGNVMQLPHPCADNDIPPEDKLFALYDMAFSNAYFGNV